MIDGKITELLQTKGMEYDETSASWYGTVSGYSMKLVRTNNRCKGKALHKKRKG